MNTREVEWFDWTEYRDQHGRSVVALVNPEDGAIYPVLDYPGLEQQAANARMMAKAPELFDLLNRFVNGINDEWHPLFWDGGLLSDAETDLLKRAEDLIDNVIGRKDETK